MTVSVSSDDADNQPEPISVILMRVLEEAMILPLLEPINRSIAQDVDRSEEKELISKMHFLSTKDQLYFGAKEELLSPRGWADAIAKINRIDETQLAPHKLDMLLEAVKAIYVEHAINCQLKKPGKETDPLGGDDFLPIFVFVVCHAKLKAPLFVRTLFWNLGSAATLRGEGGYYITVYEASLEYVKDLHLEDDPDYVHLTKHGSTGRNSFISPRRLSLFSSDSMLWRLGGSASSSPPSTSSLFSPASTTPGSSLLS